MYHLGGKSFEDFWAVFGSSDLAAGMFAKRGLHGVTNQRRWSQYSLWDREVAWIDSIYLQGKSHDKSRWRSSRSPQEVYGDREAAAESPGTHQRPRLHRRRATGRDVACHPRQPPRPHLPPVGSTGNRHPRPGWCDLRLHPLGGRAPPVKPNERHAHAINESLAAKGALRIHDRDGLPDGQAIYFTITASKAVAQPSTPTPL